MSSVSSSSSSSGQSSTMPSRSASPSNKRASKPLDITSYFHDIEGEPRKRKPKARKPIIRQRAPAKRVSLRPALTRTNSGKGDSEDEDEDEDTQRTMAEQWSKMLERQRVKEEEVRKLILGRGELGGMDLKLWLDSEDTCTLPEPSEGVRLRKTLASISLDQTASAPSSTASSASSQRPKFFLSFPLWGTTRDEK